MREHTNTRGQMALTSYKASLFLAQSDFTHKDIPFEVYSVLGILKKDFHRIIE